MFIDRHIVFCAQLTVLTYIKIMPKKYDQKFDKPIFQFLHDLFHFKKLYLEEVLKFVYVAATIATVTIGAFLLLAYEYSWGYYSSHKESTFLYGLIFIVAGPIAVRLAYEIIMMFILVVKNVIDINRKLPEPVKEEKIPEAPVAPVAPAAPVTPVAPTAPATPVAPAETQQPEINS